MRRKKLLIGISIFILLVSGAAFAAGRMINRGPNPLEIFGLSGNGISVVTEILPAEELPNIPPEVEGVFVDRQDHVLIVQGSGLNQNPEGVEVGSPEDLHGGPKLEVVVTAETMIYRDTTQLPSERPSIDNNPPIQQSVKKGVLEDLIDSQTYIMAWGRRSGDRVIAEILVYSFPGTMGEP